jgi:hypothetical protein
LNGVDATTLMPEVTLVAASLHLLSQLPNLAADFGRGFDHALKIGTQTV